MRRHLFWALREVSTKRLMPDNKVKTRAEFGDNGPPRLFTSQGAAKQALDCWRMGHWRQYGSGDGYEGPQPPDPTKAWNAGIIKRRKDVEVEIVLVRLTVV